MKMAKKEKIDGSVKFSEKIEQAIGYAEEEGLKVSEIIGILEIWKHITLENEFGDDSEEDNEDEDNEEDEDDDEEDE